MDAETRKRLIEERKRELKPLLRDYANGVLQRGSGGNFICPKCKHADLSVFPCDDGSYLWKCFQTKDHEGKRHGDIFDLYEMITGITSFSEQVKDLSAYFGLPEIGSDEAPKPFFTPKKPVAEVPKWQTTHDYTGYYAQCRGRLDETQYHRGISRGTLERFGVGYDPAWKPPLDVYLKNDPNPGDILKKRTEAKWMRITTTPRLIIPLSDSAYLARLAVEDEQKQESEFKKLKIGGAPLFNLDALKEGFPVFIVEGELDCMSVEDCGGHCVGLGSTSNLDSFIDHIKTMPTLPPFIISLDNDAAGKNAQKKLADVLTELEATYIIADELSCGYKDANAALQANRLGLTESIRRAEQKATDAYNLKLAELDAEVRKESAANALPDFLEHIKKPGQCYSTGFQDLDRILDGGLYAGLYTIGATSSLGKTTLVMQIADNLARAGNDVLIVSLEMARDELIAKSLSRLTYLKSMEKLKGESAARTTRAILNPSKWQSANLMELEVLDKAMEEYRSFADNIFVWEGMGNVTTKEIRARVQRHKAFTKKTPIIIVDYLQILAPHAAGMSDKQCTDKNVLELKRLSRDFATPVMCVSSFNRQSYLDPVGMGSFKESGSVEYSADVLLGLQYSGMELIPGDTDKTRPGRVRTLIEEQKEKGRDGKFQNIDVCILKNRNGFIDTCSLRFCPRFNLFAELGQKLDLSAMPKR